MNWIFSSKLNTFDGKNVAVTGCSKGIGRDLALQIGTNTRAEKLVLIARSTNELQELRDDILSKNPDISVFVETCDVASIHELDIMLGNIARNVGPIDILINDAACIDFALFDNESWEKMLQMLQLNVVGLTYLTHKLVSSMIQRKSGGIINIGSAAGVMFYPGSAVYNGTKHYVRGFTECLRLDLIDTGINVMEVIPGPIKTPGYDNAGALLKSDSYLDKFFHNFPLLAMISSEQCAMEIVDGYERGSQEFVPGFLFRWGLFAYQFIPRPFVRSIGRFIGSRFRRQAAEKKTEESAQAS